MKSNKKSLIAILTVMMFLTVIVAPAVCAADDMKITGQVTEGGTIVADNGDEYNIADSDMKDQIMESAGKKVSVMGAVTESEGQKTISITSYELIEE
jgi:type 1 fimbria pilin